MIEDETPSCDDFHDDFVYEPYDPSDINTPLIIDIPADQQKERPTASSTFF